MQPITHRPSTPDPVPPLHAPPEHHVEPPPIHVAVEHPEKVGQPDGVPHDIIGMLAYGIVLLIGASLIAWLWVGVWLAIVVFFVAGYVMVRGLPSRSSRERKVEARGHVIEYVHRHEHPPRATDHHH
jgi:hypothetical protein